MFQGRSFGRLSCFRVIGCLLLGGCVAGTVRRSDPFIESPLIQRVLVTRPGPLDTGNRYQSAVQVISRETAGGPEEPAPECSGSLIGPRLVLTAAHCVCKKRNVVPEDLAKAPARARDLPAGDVVQTRALAIHGRAVEAIATASDCAKRSQVKAVVYVPSKRHGKPVAQVADYEGAVRAHPDFELLLDKANILWSNADLAVIFLTEAVDGISPSRLAAAEVQVGDRITLVGYGLGETQVGFGERRFGDNRVSWIRRLESGSVEFIAGEQLLEDGKPASHLYGGDSGGGCFKADDSKVLLGVNGSRALNAKGEAFSIFTSVYSHRPWIERQIEEARRGLDDRDGG